MPNGDMYKIVYNDGGCVKAITSKILDEDDFFIKILAIRTQTKMRIGKGTIISIKPLSGGQ